MQDLGFQPSDVLNLWFPDSGHQNAMETHAAFWKERMQGGMDEQIIADFSALTHAAATGALDKWAKTARGRLALLIALDQFPRSLWRDTPMAFAQDIKSTRLVLQGIENGDFDALKPWEQGFFVIALGHCEGPDHLQRLALIDKLTTGIVSRLPDVLAPMGEVFVGQNVRVRTIIEKFGRHPHRNGFLGRLSTPEEETYIATGDFPHLAKPEEQAGRGK